MTKPRQLSRRQQVLFDRLVMLGQSASTGQFPFRIMEIIGFGSFFRGKPSPRDVDLVLRVERPEHTPQFSKFVEYLEEIRENEEFQQSFSTPLEAILELLKRRSGRRLPGLEDTEESPALFQRWLEGYSWAMLFPRTIADQCSITSPDGFARRLLKREFPNLNVIRIETHSLEAKHPVGLRCGFTVSIWTPERRDILANLHSLLAPEAVADNVFRELAYFRIQLPRIKAQVDLNHAEIDLILRTEDHCDASDDKWFERIAADDSTLSELRQLHEVALAAASEFDQVNQTQTNSVARPNGVSLAQATELTDEMRAEIKLRYDQADLLADIRASLLWHKSGKANTNLTPKEYAVSELLSRGNAQAKKKARQLLTEMSWIKDNSPIS